MPGSPLFAQVVNGLIGSILESVTTTTPGVNEHKVMEDAVRTEDLVCFSEERRKKSKTQKSYRKQNLQKTIKSKIIQTKNR